MKTFTFAYDLGSSMEPVEGALSFDSELRLVSVQDGVTLLDMVSTDVEEAGVVAGVGCGMMYVKMRDGGERLLCRFTMSALKPAGEFCKVVNYFAQTGTTAIPDEREKQVCDECGRPFIEGMKVCLFCYNRTGVLKRSYDILKPHVRKLIGAESLHLISMVLFLFIPLFNRYLIDDYLRPMRGVFTDILFLGLAMLLARSISEVLFILCSRVFNRVTIGYANDLRTLTYDKIQRLSLSSLSKRTPGDLIRRIMEDTTTIKDFMSDAGRWAVEQALMFVVVLVILLITNARLTVLVFLPIPIVAFALSRFWGLIHIRYERQWRKSSRCNSILYDIIKGIRAVKSFGNEEFEIKKFSAATRELAQVSSDNESLWALLFPTVTFFTGIGEFLVLYFGGRAIFGNEPTLTLGILVQFTMYIGYIYGPLRWLVSFPRWLGDAMTSMLKVFEILDEEPDIIGKDDPHNVPVAGNVTFENVSFGYKSYEPVLKDISLTIQPGEMIGIVGKSGVGKSTLINLLIRLYDPNAGSVKINGTDLRDMSPEHIHENIGIVFQDPFLFAGTIYDNVAYAKPDATAHEVVAACKAANAHDFIMATSDGYDTLIGESGYSISGGERQRLSIARAIIKNPDILILDEATSSLDVETEAEIQKSMANLTRGRTTVAIAHRLSTLSKADRLIVLDKGKVAESGTHAELLKQRGIYYNLVMAQRRTGKIAEA